MYQSKRTGRASAWEGNNEYSLLRRPLTKRELIKEDMLIWRNFQYWLQVEAPIRRPSFDAAGHLDYFPSFYQDMTMMQAIRKLLRIMRGLPDLSERNPEISFLAASTDPETGLYGCRLRHSAYSCGKICNAWAGWKIPMKYNVVDGKPGPGRNCLRYMRSSIRCCWS